MVKGKNKTSGKDTLVDGNDYSVPFQRIIHCVTLCVHLQSQVKHLIGTCHPLSISVKTIIALHWVLKSEI